MAQKTTVYFPEDLKAALAREAKRRGCSEAEVIRGLAGSSTTTLHAIASKSFFMVSGSA
jgi:hypothetical protein